jgi:hypothetical protein
MTFLYYIGKDDSIIYNTKKEIIISTSYNNTYIKYSNNKEYYDILEKIRIKYNIKINITDNNIDHHNEIIKKYEDNLKTINFKLSNEVRYNNIMVNNYNNIDYLYYLYFKKNLIEKLILLKKNYINKLKENINTKKIKYYNKKKPYYNKNIKVKNLFFNR